jgi:quinol monooxygenase YgiN
LSKDLTQADGAAPKEGLTPDFAADKKAYAAYVARLREKRQPFAGFTQKLAYPPRAGYYRYWFNDEPGRVLQARDAGYEHVKNPATQEHEKRVVGTRKEGGALWAYLMEIPTEIWEDDQKLKRQRGSDQYEAAIKKSRVIAKTDAEAREDEGNFYVPGGGSKIEHGVGRKRL